MNHQVILNHVGLDEKSRQLWLFNFASDARSLIINKWEAGAKEHKGDLGDVSVEAILNEMLCEATDQICYVGELKRRLADNLIVAIDKTTLKSLVIGYQRMLDSGVTLNEEITKAFSAATRILSGQPQQT